jgi:hypothetical protein
MTEDWTINRLSDETGLDRRTLKKILQNTAPNDVDGKSEFYKLADFVKALREYDKPKGEGSEGDLIRERTRLTAADADIREVERALLKGEVIKTDVFIAGLQNLFIPLVRAIWTSNLTKAEKTTLINECNNACAVKYFLGITEADRTDPTEGSEVPSAAA